LRKGAEITFGAPAKAEAATSALRVGIDALNKRAQRRLDLCSFSYATFIADNRSTGAWTAL